MAQSQQEEGGDLVNEGLNRVTAEGGDEEEDLVDASESVASESKMLQQQSSWTSSSSGGSGSGVGSGRSARANPVYVSLPTDDSLSSEILNIKNGSLPLLTRRRSCPIATCDHLKDILFQYYKQLLLFVVFGVTGGVFVVFSRQYVFKAIDVLRNVNVALQCFLFLLFFVICSFPLMWGYIVLVISAGLLHGAVKGSAIVVVSAGAGVTISHFVLSSCLRDVVKRKILPSRNGLKALINAVDGVNGMRVVCLARLTPIPFGIQNAIFAISVLPRWKYVAASMLGLLPGQLIEAYIGSSLKNLGELYSHSHASPTNVTIVAIQIGITLCLFYYLFYLAKKELNKITLSGGGGVGEDCVTLIPDRDAKTEEIREAEIRFHLMENSQMNKNRSPILAERILEMDSD